MLPTHPHERPEECVAMGPHLRREIVAAQTRTRRKITASLGVMLHAEDREMYVFEGIMDDIVP